MPVPAAVHVYSIPMRARFRGITVRQGVLVRGAAGWGEWSPFLDYGDAEIVSWLRAADEAAERGWPAPVRDAVPVNCTVPAVGPAEAYALVAASGCRTAKVKVAEPGQTLGDDLERVEAVRAALGTSGAVRVDANGAWSVGEALGALRALDRFTLEYAEQPCLDVADLAELRRRIARAGLDIRIAADESIRRAADPYRVARLEAADVAVLKVQPLGGVRACLAIAERLGLPVVVSSALETSVGLRAGIALAAALPELPFACGLNTAGLLAADVGVPPVRAIDGAVPVPGAGIDLPDDTLASVRADPDAAAFWQARLVRARRLMDRDADDG